MAVRLERKPWHPKGTKLTVNRRAHRIPMFADRIYMKGYETRYVPKSGTRKMCILTEVIPPTEVIVVGIDELAIGPYMKQENTTVVESKIPAYKVIDAESMRFTEPFWVLIDDVEA